MVAFSSCTDGGNGGFQNLPSEDGTYAVAIVSGDATSLVHTNNMLLNGLPLTDPDPYDPNATPGYAKGDFDGWAQDVTVTDGFITITAGAGAIDPTLCFIEVGPKDSHVDQAAQDRLAKVVMDATNRTGGEPYHKSFADTRTFVYGGDYIDSPLMMQVKSGTVAKSYYIHANSLYSVQTVTDATGAIVEQYAYGAYGDRKIAGGTSSESAIGLTVGFTGLRNEGDLVFARGRYLSPNLGRWISRDTSGYVDGPSLYRAFFIPLNVDPSGLVSLSMDFPKGTMKGNVNELYGKNAEEVKTDISFKPKDDCVCNDISFIQVILFEGWQDPTSGQLISAGLFDPELMVNNGKSHLDVHTSIMGDYDPYFGTWFNNGKWVDQDQHGTVGGGPDKKVATLSDNPSFSLDEDTETLHKSQDKIKRFTTIAVCIETGEKLGVANWGFVIPHGSNIAVPYLNKGTFGGVNAQIASQAINAWNSYAQKNNYVKGLLK